MWHVMKCKAGFHFCKFEKANFGSHFISKDDGFSSLVTEWNSTDSDSTLQNYYITFIKITVYYETKCCVLILHILIAVFDAISFFKIAYFSNVLQSGTHRI